MIRWRVGVIGAGLIGSRRAHVAHEHPNCRVVRVADTDLARARTLAGELDAKATGDWREVVGDPEVNLVVVATPTDSHALLACAALKARQHVLCEKPLARTSAEARRMVQAASRYRVKLKTGFNHRYHPGIFRAQALASAGEIGKLMLVRCVYGHGGREGYEKEWRMQPKISGGGELMDQGIHALDLFRWFLGEFREAYGMVGTLFWPIRPVEDNAFAVLRTRGGAIAQIHASWTQWKNRFSFEVFGEKGYLLVEGLGKSYGAERLTIGRRTRLGAVPEETVEEFPGPDISWAREWEEFIEALEENKDPLATGRDGYEALRLVEAIYRSNRAGRVVKL